MFLIVDGHAILHRAYHSMPPLTHNGQPVNAIYGFYSMLLTGIDQLKPEYLAVCLDAPGPVFRSQQFIGYRAQRRAPEDNLLSQLPLLQQTLDQADILHFYQTGYEADDLIASLVNQLPPKINQITIITGDKDLMQLVTPKVKLFVPLRGMSHNQIYTPKKVKQKLGVKPSQVVDYKALVGDPSDNYPGVNGVGPKTATDLLSRFPTLDLIYQHLNQLKPNLAEKLQKHQEDAYLSQKLARLIDNLKIKINLPQAKWDQDQQQKLFSLFKTYNFKSLASRLQRKYDLPKDPNQSSLF